MENYILVRYGEIGKKSEPVRSQMEQTLRQRVEDKLLHEEIEFDKISLFPGRIIVETEDTKKAAEKLKLIPGISSISPATKVTANLKDIKEVAKEKEFGQTFGVRINTAFTDLESQEVERKLGAFIEEEKDISVDLDNPDTWLEVDIRDEEAYVFSKRITGIDGLPVGTQDEYAALVSGGIDSPVAAFEMMKRGADITPIYFYNRPIAAEDHLIRFEQVIEKLKSYHPGKKWEFYVVDMEEVNQELLDKIGKGRMVLHRKIMFKVAEELADQDNLKGIVTGESLGQKSSQTAQNLEITTKDIEKPLMRPLLSWNKNEAVNKAKEIGTFELAKVDSACRTLSPDNPATELKEDKLNEIEEKVDLEEMVVKAVDSAEKREI